MRSSDRGREVVCARLRRSALTAVAALIAASAVACNAIVGNDDIERYTADATQPPTSSAPTLRSPGRDDATLPETQPDGGSTTPLTEADAAVPVDAGPRTPSASCVQPGVKMDALLRVEIDANPAPVANAGTVSAFLSVFGNNAQSNMRLDLCTPDGPLSNVGGGMNFLGGGGAVTRHWQTKQAVTVPLGVLQAQVFSDDGSGTPALKMTFDLTIQ